MVQLKREQYMFLLMEIKEDQVDNVIDRVLGKWKRQHESGIRIDYRVQMLYPDGESNENNDRRHGRRYI